MLERSEARICDILKRSDSESHLLTRGKLGETPLHVAASWPQGMELLLQLAGENVSSIIDAEDDNGSTALEYALKMNEPDCVKMLLDSSAEMNLEALRNISIWEQGRQKWAIIPVLTHFLAERRRELVHFAIEIVHQKPDIENLILEEGDLLQEDAFELVQTLLASGINVPKRFRNVQPGSVYHCAQMNFEMAEALFKAGFDHTATEFMGFTPLMIVDLVALSHRHVVANLLGLDPGALELVDWFLSHGENLKKPLPTKALTLVSIHEKKPHGPCLAHRIASELGRCLRWPLALSGNRCSTFLPVILTSTITDSCACLCTQNGCTSASVFARELWGSIRGDSTSHKQPVLNNGSVRTIIDLLERELVRHPEARQFTSSLIRVSTFERLGMSHTCCKFVENSGKYEGPDDGVALAILRGEYRVVEMMDPEDAAEIQDEERYLAKRLEELVHEFDVKYEELGLALGEFFWSYWWVRMGEVEAEAEVSREELVALRRTGVVLEYS